MHAYSRDRELALSRLKLEKRPLTSSQIAILLRKPTKQFANQLSKHLLYLWRAGKITRSAKQIRKEYYYFHSANAQHLSVKDQKIDFIAYRKKLDSRNLKKKIIKILVQNAPLTVKEITHKIKPDFDLAFLKKINFHLQDLYTKKKLLRSSKPYRYYLKEDDKKSIDDSKSSVPALVADILLKSKTALFTSEIISELKKRSIPTKLSTVSIALKRLKEHDKILSSRTQSGTRNKKTGYIWALSGASIRERFIKELPAAVKELLIKDTITDRDICNALCISPANSKSWLERISAELDYGLQKDEVVRRVT